MKKRIAVLTSDDYLYQKIYLSLKNHAEVYRASASSLDEAELILTDDEGSILDKRFVLMGRGENARLIIPFSSDALFSAVFGEDKKQSSLRINGRLVYFKGKKIKLTEVEHSLLSALIAAKGNFTTRDSLLKAVWGDGADGGVLNVYIHYLREKLEACGEKVIISSRKQGYKIDEKYLNGEEDAEC